MNDEGNSEAREITTVHAPFTDAQVAALNKFQTLGAMHPFTCPKHDDMRTHVCLVATNDGFVCAMQECTYTQLWAHDFMCDPEAVASMEQMMSRMFGRTSS